MGCNCGKKNTTVAAPRAARALTSPIQAQTVVVYDVFDHAGALVASSSSSVQARTEARRSGGTVVPRRTTQAKEGTVG